MCVDSQGLAIQIDRDLLHDGHGLYDLCHDGRHGRWAARRVVGRGLTTMEKIVMVMLSMSLVVVAGAKE